MEQVTAGPTQISPRFSQMAALFAAIQPLTGLGMKAWGFTSMYTRRHPVRVAFSVIAIGLLAAKMMNKKTAPIEKE